MNEVTILSEQESETILKFLWLKNVPVIMSYLSNGTWMESRLIFTALEHDHIRARITPKKRSQKSTLQIGQSVGMSFKYGFGGGYDKFVFDTTVIRFDQMDSPQEQIVFSIPHQIELVQRRSYFRVEVPSILDIDVTIWQRQPDGRYPVPPSQRRYWQTKLIDISAGGMQVALEASAKLNFNKDDSIGVRLTPLPYETPLMFNAQIRTIFKAANDKNICLGLQMIGLEASPEGRLVIQRLCSVADQYHTLNQAQEKKMAILESSIS